MKRIRIVLICVAIMFLTSCTKPQKIKVDQLAETAAHVAAGGEAVLQSPIGQLVPPDIRFYMTLAGAVIMAAVGGWQKYRKDQLTKTTTAIVRGIESQDDCKAVKTAIAGAMKSIGIYDAGNKIVDQLKTV